MLDDLEALDPDRWCVTRYSALLADPDSELARLCTNLDLTWDREPGGELFACGDHLPKWPPRLGSARR